MKISLFQTLFFILHASPKSFNSVCQTVKLRVYVFRTCTWMQGPLLHYSCLGKGEDNKKQVGFFLYFVCYACAGICSNWKINFESLYLLGRKSVQWLLKWKIFHSCSFYSWFYMLATDEPVINQCKPRTPTLFLLRTELGYFLLPALLSAVHCTGSFPVLKKDLEMKLLPHFRS